VEKNEHENAPIMGVSMLDLYSASIYRIERKNIPFWGIGTMAHPLPQPWLPVFLVVAVHLRQRCAGGVLMMLICHPITDLSPTQTVSSELCFMSLTSANPDFCV
jgi:hypothetical protein